MRYNRFIIDFNAYKLPEIPLRINIKECKTTPEELFCVYQQIKSHETSFEIIAPIYAGFIFGILLSIAINQIFGLSQVLAREIAFQLFLCSLPGFFVVRYIQWKNRKKEGELERQLIRQIRENKFLFSYWKMEADKIRKNGGWIVEI